MRRRWIVVVGASMAGLRAAQTLRREGFEGPVTVIGRESHAPYQRPPLSKQFLGSGWPQDKLGLRLDPRLGIEMYLGAQVLRLDLARRRLVVHAAGSTEVVEFSGLVIATGAQPRVLPQRQELAGVFVLRGLDDALAIRAWLDRKPRVVVLGAGFVGAEVAATCRERGLSVSIVEPLPVPLFRALGREMGEFIGRLHTDHGTRLHLGRSVTSLEGGDCVEGVRLDDGRVLEADMVVMGLGVRPSTDWLTESGLILDNGVVCDEGCMAVGVSNVVAAGDVARWSHRRYGRHHRIEHWTHAAAQGESAARTLLQGRDQAEAFDPLPLFWSDQYGTKLQMLGLPEPEDHVRVVEGDLEQRRFVVAYGRGGRTTGALVVNLPHRMNAWRTLVDEATSFSPDMTPRLGVQ